MDEVGNYVASVRYPAGRLDLLTAARASGAPAALLSRLELLENRNYANVEEVRYALVQGRAESNPGLVAITPGVCPDCGFSRMPGQAHSCIEEKARFAESVQAVTDEFDLIDDEAESAGPSAR